MGIIEVRDAIMEHQKMTLQDIIDIHALNEDIEAYERKYGVRSETFYESYINGEEPKDGSWILDWANWAGAYKIMLRRRKQYRRTIQTGSTQICGGAPSGYARIVPIRTASRIWGKSTIAPHTRGWHTPSEHFYPTNLR